MDFSENFGGDVRTRMFFVRQDKKNMCMCQSLAAALLNAPKCLLPSVKPLKPKQITRPVKESKGLKPSQTPAPLSTLKYHNSSGKLPRQRARQAHDQPSAVAGMAEKP